jgi:uncharacterized protein YecE (DUF72 family)
MLRRYAADYPTVEITDTFAGIPPAALIGDWRDAVPDGFRFALKVPQQVTHERRFVGTSRLLWRFLERVILLENKLGPLLLSMSTALSPNEDTRRALKNFVHSLPAGFSWALECRRADWITAELLELLRSRNVSLALADDRWIRRRLMLDLAGQPTADFAYIRWVTPNPPPRQQSDKPGSSKRTLSMWSPVLLELQKKVTFIFGFLSSRFYGDPFPLCAAMLQDMVTANPGNGSSPTPLPPTSQLCIFCRNETSRCNCSDKTKQS